MATHQSNAQKETVERVMHEFNHGELKTSRGKKVKNAKQAIAIGLHEAGASNSASKEENRQNLKRTKARERRERPRRTATSREAGVNLLGRSSMKRRSGGTFPADRR